MDDDGRQIEVEYTPCRTSEGGSRTRDPAETFACHVDELRILKSGDYYIDISGRSDHVRRPTTQELHHIAGGISGAQMYGTIWAQKHVVHGAEPKELTAKGEGQEEA